ncbi:helix-turn-helix transcriptional regulator [Halostagnicola sp. A-GB9-2]|uniref:helix-turn-helix transcriptional regulator n=1 Tax=Halostagnicola sp. A-GB9-2 TaxID=3048066 RepID=UPI0024C062AC|nr:helix-turn-helix transcriptional regulator [Halostagnicola sp. A-GB9-2]MDJ1434647.1 helix-turn-helix transcriptional regulator [Halostagnicola sp. A-GB9-2]
MDNDLPERRKAQNLSQGELAEAVDVTRQTINAIERDRYDPSLELAFKLASHFDCEIEAIFDPSQNGNDPS